MAITTTDFQFISDFARSNAAIILENGKEYLVESRLEPLAKQEGFGDITGLIEALKKDPSGSSPIYGKTVEALTTNETSFFRDFHPFETLRKHILPGLIESRKGTRSLKIWCAAASTGQEPYSIAMLIREHFPQLASWNVEIRATDINTKVLDTASQGSYSQFEINRGLPAIFLVKYFEQKDTRWVLKEDIRRMIKFSQLNLIKPWPFAGKVDIIFIRNVLIYFNGETKTGILGNIRRLLTPDGIMFLGGAESTINLDPNWSLVNHDRTTVFQPKG